MRILNKLEDAVFEHDGAEFTVSPLTAAQRISVYAALDSDIGEAYAKLCRFCVKGWRGVTDETGVELPFSVGEMDRLFSHPSASALLVALGAFVLDRSSVPVPTSPGASPQP